MESEEEDYEDLSLEEAEQYEHLQLIPNISNISETKFSSNDIFYPLKEFNLFLKEDEFNLKIYNETKKIQLYLMESIDKFIKIFINNDNDNNDNPASFSDVLNYLEKRAIKNECICAGVIDLIPGWKCEDCSIYENSIYCSDCYINSKDLHKNHKVYFLYSAAGMCDCGDPGSLKMFCNKHTGPFKSQEEIKKFIEKSFSENEIKNLTNFFDEFFYKFSRYFFLFDDFNLFYNQNFEEFFSKSEIEEKDEIKKDIILLKKNFCIVFQNFLNFLRPISQKNMGMLHFLANYFIKNNLYINSKSDEDDKEFMTKHKCYIIEKNDIKILNENGEQHKCQCPFIRLFMINYREEIKSKENENKEFLLLFPHNFFLKNYFCISFFFLNKQILLNNNVDILGNKNQFFSEDIIELLATKTTLIEETYDIFYDYFKEAFTSFKYKNKEGNIINTKLESLLKRCVFIENDTKYYSKPKISSLFSKKTFIIKKIIDTICLLHNQMEFKSIYPHPFFQENRGFSKEIVEIEYNLLEIIENIIMYINWNELSYSEEIFKYLIYKIINQEKEGIKQLKENEFSFHLCLYRCFGLLINDFCFNYSIKNNCTLMQSIEYFKNFFDSKKEIELFVDKLMKDYFVLLGFIGGINNNYFNYYESMINYPLNYINKNIYIKIDICTLKYLFALSDKKFDLIQYLKISNVENVFKIFKTAFFKENESILLNGKKSPFIFFDESDEKNKEKDLFKYEFDKTNYVMQLIFLFYIIIKFMKNDSCHYFCLMRKYNEVLSSQKKKELFDIIKNNKHTYEDLKNILIENIILKMVSHGNLVDLRMLKKNINKNLIYIFNEDNTVQKILDELTENKMKGEKKIFYLKDKYLNNLDMNYYINPNDKSKAQRYIQNFKNDEIKLYNKYYNKVSKLTFDFLENTYEKILLNKDNLFTFKKMIEVLIESNEKLVELERKSLRNSILPTILNYLSNFGVINTKSFINFKIQNKEIINDIKNILIKSIKKNKTNELFGKDLEEYIQLVIKELDYYMIINNEIKDDLNQLNENGFMTKYIQKIKKENKEENNINININETNSQKIRAQKLREIYKSKVKNNLQNFIEKSITDKNIENNLKISIEEEKKEENKNEIMCFYCRNKIELNKWNKPYGKVGLLINDYFYSNSIKSTLRNEINKINKNNKNKQKLIYEQYFWENDENKDKNLRIVSCGHYFHYECIKPINDKFSCPICLKEHSIIIPPLNILKKENEYNFLNGEKIEILAKPDEKEENSEKIDPNILQFLEYISAFLLIIFKKEQNNIIDLFYETYKNNFNFLGNIFYSEGSTFNKKQQIDNLQNIILSFRYMLGTNNLRLANLKSYIKSNLNILLSYSDENNIIRNCKNMFYVKLLDKILLSLTILFDYDELKQTFKYLIYIFLPYFSFGNYLRYLIINDIALNQINIDQFKKYIMENNEEMVNIFKIFLQKLTLIKLITDYNNKNDEIIKSFNEFSIEQFLTLLNIDNLYILLSKNINEINFLDIFVYLPKIFNSNEILFKEYKNNFNDIFNIIIKNIKFDFETQKESLTKELIINFNPIKFDFIEFDKKIFDWIENNLNKKCKICSKHSKYSYICLICGNKVCHINSCNQFMKHAELCNGNNSIFLDMDDMKICISIEMRYMHYFFSLYLNKNGIGPSGFEIGNNYTLSEENLKFAIKNFISYDFFFK